MSTQIDGEVAPGFAGVEAAFRENFLRRGEVGAAFCVFLDGRPVVDLWGGLADVQQQRPWARETQGVIFSSTKGLAALCLLMQAERGNMDYDVPVAEYWPGFAQNGKETITVRTLLNHRGGLCALDQPLSIADFAERPEAVLAACEAQEPLWPPGTDQGYHATTFGPYVAELFKRVAGESLGTFLQREVADPLGADVVIGLAEDHGRDVATLYPPSTRDKLTLVLPKVFVDRGRDGRMFRQAARRGSVTQRAFANPADLGAKGLTNYNSPQVRRLELPWANGIASARGLARVYAALSLGGELDGVRLVKPKSLAPLRHRQSWVPVDRVLRKPLGFAQGFLKEETTLFSPEEASFGHPGAGGALGWCDPVNRLSIGYVMNKMAPQVRSSRALALSQAVYRALGLKAG